MTTIDKSKPVMVTGATGYVAGWLVQKLLEEGLTVHAPIRNPNDKDKLKYLDEIEENSSGEIKYFEADLLEPGSYDEAVSGCELVFHTASPFTSIISDPQKDLVDPALKGTRNVLESVNKTETVKRVVLTSSCAAIIGDAVDIQNYPNQIATENEWNSTSSLEHQAYSYSKTVAEKEAWKINESQNRWDLVVINPSFVIGPGINPRSTSESYNIVKQFGDGKMKTGVPPFNIGVVDVRDVAEAHYKAGFKPEAEGRHITSAETKSFIELVEYLRPNFGDKYPLPKRELPKFMVWLFAPTVGVSRKMVSKNMGHDWRVDNSKSKVKLGISYTDPKKSINDFFEQMVEEGIFEN